MAGKKKYPTDDLIAALVRTKGNVTKAAMKLGCTRNTIQKRMQEDAKIRTEVNWQIKRRWTVSLGDPKTLIRFLEIRIADKPWEKFAKKNDQRLIEAGVLNENLDYEEAIKKLKRGYLGKKN